jgi:hypothetical protein
MTGRDELRVELVIARGLNPDAASLLTGTGVEELEASADELAKLVGARSDDQEPEQTDLADLFTNVSSVKARRKRQLAELLVGDAPQPRDERGRWAGFDGGARPSPPAAPPSHDEWLLEVLRDQAGRRAMRF